MNQPTWRLWMKVRDPGVLAQYMEFRGLKVRSLADRVGVSRATIGHLRSGARKTIKPELAREIARVLEAPEGLLFVPEVSRVTREGSAA